MLFRRSFLWPALLTFLLLLLLSVLGKCDSWSCDATRHVIAFGHFDYDSEVGSSQPANNSAAAELWGLDVEEECNGDTIEAEAFPYGSDHDEAVAVGKHPHRLVGDKVSTEQPNVSYMESLVPTLAELSEDAWVNATVPFTLTYFIEIRTSKLISLAQILNADASLSAGGRHRLMERLRVNLNAVMRVGDKLCGEISTYADHVAARALEQEGGEASTSFVPGTTDAVGESASDTHVKQHDSQAPTEVAQVRADILSRLQSRSADWREAIRVCRMLTYKIDYYRPIIDRLMNSESSGYQRQDQQCRTV
jgi:hypothetical protein